nr:MAG TPA: hypothetical protein [Bacteriophage sp.]
MTKCPRVLKDKFLWQSVTKCDRLIKNLPYRQSPCGYLRQLLCCQSTNVNLYYKLSH